MAVKRIEDGPAMTPVLFLMNPTLVAQVRAVADADLVMPHKSTFFYPKILTGLLLNKIVADERVGVTVPALLFQRSTVRWPRPTLPAFLLHSAWL